jgi:hypothetical protein
LISAAPDLLAAPEGLVMHPITQQTWSTLTRPQRVRNIVAPPMLPDEIHDPRERRRAQKREQYRREQRRREVQCVY